MTRTALAELAIEFGDYRAHGYKVERYGPDGWLLTHDGSQLQVAGYGGISPTRYAAELEAYSRIAADDRLTRHDPASAPQTAADAAALRAAVLIVEDRITAVRDRLRAAGSPRQSADRDELHLLASAAAVVASLADQIEDGPTD